MVKKIISGGQTGVDRMALDVALELGIPCGGWCPQGRKAEDGVIDSKYPLTELPSGGYRKRTEWNIKDSDGTLIINMGELSGGTLLTYNLAQKHGKPCFIVDAARPVEAKLVKQWLAENNIEVLNVAGPRASNRPGIVEASRQILVAVSSGSLGPPWESAKL